MNKEKERLKGKESQNKNFESLSFFEVYGEIAPLTVLSINYRGILSKNNIERQVLYSKIQDGLKSRGLNENNITASKMKKSVIYVYLDTGENIQINIDSLKKAQIKDILGNDNRKKTEENVSRLQNAIETIYSKNKGYIWNDEINDKDTIDVKGFGKNLTLKEIKKILDIESEKLKKIYEITGETEKYTDLLKQELKFYVGVGDKYEGGARYFSISQKEIKLKVTKLSNSMSISELIEYIKHNNKQISDNYKKSEMVNQTNKKLMNFLYEITFGRLREEDASNKDFIDFAKALTGRGELGLNHYQTFDKPNYGNYKNRDTFNYGNLDIDDEYKEIDMANNVLIFVMYKKDGILDEMKEKHLNDFKIEDEEIGYRAPSKVISDGLRELSKLNKNDPNYARNIFKEANFSSLLDTNKNYNELSFDEKVSLGAIARITKILKEATPEELKNPDFVRIKFGKTVKESFDELNDSFSDNIDGIGGMFGKSARDLGLSGEFAEIFELYQDINGNNGLFDLSDNFKDGLMGLSTATVLGVSIIAGLVIFGPIIAALEAGTVISSSALLFAGSTVNLGVLFTSGAILGTTAGVTNIIVQRQGYDTTNEAITDMSLQIGADAIISGIFTMVGVPIVAKFGNPNPDLFFSLPAWTTSSGLADKGFIVGETVVTGMFVSPIFSQGVRNLYSEDHFNTDKFSYEKGKIVKKLDK